jgi:hypothetical protein
MPLRGESLNKGLYILVSRSLISIANPALCAIAKFGKYVGCIRGYGRLVPCFRNSSCGSCNHKRQRRGTLRTVSQHVGMSCVKSGRLQVLHCDDASKHWVWFLHSRLRVWLSRRYEVQRGVVLQRRFCFSCTDDGVVRMWTCQRKTAYELACPAAAVELFLASV